MKQHDYLKSAIFTGIFVDIEDNWVWSICSMAAIIVIGVASGRNQNQYYLLC